MHFILHTANVIYKILTVYKVDLCVYSQRNGSTNILLDKQFTGLYLPIMSLAKIRSVEICMYVTRNMIVSGVAPPILEKT